MGENVTGKCDFEDFRRTSREMKFLQQKLLNISGKTSLYFSIDKENIVNVVKVLQE